jgi:hypothetical protein
VRFGVSESDDDEIELGTDQDSLAEGAAAVEQSEFRKRGRRRSAGTSTRGCA